MIYHRVYKCPKCFNTLLVSNKMLHDLRCTEENPATYENILFRQNQEISNNTSYNNYNNSGYGEKMSIKNDDGTMIDIRKEKSLRGKDEYVEIKYDPQGNVISRKKASDYGYGNEDSLNEFSEFNEYEDDDFNLNYDNNNNTYYEINSKPEIKKAPSVIVETAEAQEIVIEAPAKYDPHVIINKPIFQGAVINSNDEVSDGIIDNIIRNTLNRNNDNNSSNSDNNYIIKNNVNNNKYDYSTQNISQSKDINKNSYNINYTQNINPKKDSYNQNYTQSKDINKNSYNINYTQKENTKKDSYNQNYTQSNDIIKNSYIINYTQNEKSKKDSYNQNYTQSNDINKNSYIINYTQNENYKKDSYNHNYTKSNDINKN